MVPTGPEQLVESNAQRLSHASERPDRHVGPSRLDALVILVAEPSRRHRPLRQAALETKAPEPRRDRAELKVLSPPSSHAHL
jgi:hypothetical protein